MSSSDTTQRGDIEEPVEPNVSRSGIKRGLLLAAGWLAIGLGLVGVILPLLPTTPFLLLSAACFVRSSPRLHRRLLENKHLGPYLKQWDRKRSIPPRAKRRAYLLVILTFSLSIVIMESLPLRILLGVLGAVVLLILSRLKGEDVETESSDAAAGE